MSKGKLANYYDKTRRGLGYVIPPTPLQSEEDKSFPSYSSTSSEGESDVSVGVLFKNLFVNITSINWSMKRLLKCLTLSHGLSNSISSGKSDLNNVNYPLSIG